MHSSAKVVNGDLRTGALRAAVSMAILGAVSTLQCLAGPSEFFLSPQGSDSNDGTKSSPFRSFERARDAIRALKQARREKLGADAALPAGGVFVTAGAGDYPPAQSFQSPIQQSSSGGSVLSLDPAQDSGAPGSPIVYRSDGSGTVQLLGGPRLYPSAWSPAGVSGSGLFQANLSALGLAADDLGSINAGALGDCASNQLTELVYRGEPMVRARFPNMNYSRSDLPLPAFRHIASTVSGQPLQFVANRTDGPMLQRWADEMAESGSDVWVGGYWMYGWADSYCKLESIDPASGLVTVRNDTPPVYGFKPKARFFGVNLFSELDQEKEYFINKTSMTIFFMTPDGKAPVEPAYLTLSPVVVGLEGQAEVARGLAQERAREQELRRTRARDAAAFEQATLSGIELSQVIGNKGTPEYAERRVDYFTGLEARAEQEFDAIAASGGTATPLQFVQLIGLTASYGMYGVVFNNVENVVLDQIDASANTAHALRLTGYNNTLSNSKASYSGCTAMAFEGGDKTTLTPSGSRAINNTATYFARWKRTYQPGLGFGGVGVEFRDNTIGFAPHICMTGSGNDHLFVGNTMQTAVYEVSDSGCWYSGRSWAHRGSKLFNNSFLHCKDIEPTFLGYPETHGVYFDDELSAHETAFNYFLDAYQGVFVGGGRRHSVHDNVFEQIVEPFQMDDRGLNWQKQYCNATDGIFFQELEALHYQQPPYSTHYPELVNIRTDHPCVPVYNKIVNNTWCPLSGTKFSNTPAATAAKWLTTIANNTPKCPPQM